MGGFTRRGKAWVALAFLTLGSEGCVTGHLFDAALRREQPVSYHDALVDGDRLTLGYTALVTTDSGKVLARKERRAAISLTALRRHDLPVEAFPVEHLADDAPLTGRRLAIAAQDGEGGAPAYLETEAAPDGREMRFVLHDSGGGPYAPFYSNALTRTSTALWVYPLLPVGAAADLATFPILLVFFPVVLLVGD
ncbi:MAG TPA: hypothetical protein VKM54_03720 [Myxococcota bacterium]|nr:hypothetical protein [Myxococcota bacterium]